MRAKFIYEKFSDESDPIKDMGIGMIDYWKKTAEEIGHESEATFSAKYLHNKYRRNGLSLGEIIWSTFVKASHGEDVQKAFEISCKEIGYRELRELPPLKQRILMANAMEKYFKTSVDPYFLRKKEN